MASCAADTIDVPASSEIIPAATTREGDNGRDMFAFHCRIMTSSAMMVGTAPPTAWVKKLVTCRRPMACTAMSTRQVVKKARRTSQIDPLNSQEMPPPINPMLRVTNHGRYSRGAATRVSRWLRASSRSTSPLQIWSTSFCSRPRRW